jgi:4-amino-4-deoxy-L-arabinose transferase-like glycosyltransferase
MRTIKTPYSFWHVLALGLAVVYGYGLFIPLMEVDAAQYASISMEMLQNDHWLEVQHRLVDYLDKPPLLFWTAALSFKIFGYATWAYKLPSLLAAFLGIYGLFRFTRLFYGFDIARTAAFILAGCVGCFLLGNDVRTDTLLLGTTTCAIWQLAEYQYFRNWKNIFGAGLFIGLAMLSKGPIGAVVPACAIGMHLVVHRRWAGFFDWKWLGLLLVVLLVLAPMCWGLYTQFDLHPEKEINGRTGVSGLYFFFWEQSFGRITGGNVWKNDTTALYFLHVSAWAFLPWTILFLAALVQKTITLFKQKFRLFDGQEGYALGAFVLPFIALSMSHYKLPHYIFVTLPWAAVLLAAWAGSPATEPGTHGRLATVYYGIRHWKNWEIWTWRVHYGLIMTAVWWIVSIAFTLIFPSDNAIVLVLITALIWLVIMILPRFGVNMIPATGIQRTLVWSVVMGFWMNAYFYPSLLPYQATTAAGEWAKAHHLPADKTTYYQAHGHALEFHYGTILTQLYIPKDVYEFVDQHGETWMFTGDTGKQNLDGHGIHYTVLATFEHFPVTQLNARFLNTASRNRVLEHRYWLKIEKGL